MNPTLYLLAGHVFITVGAFVLYRTFGQLAGLSAWLLAEGVVAAVGGMLMMKDEESRKAWHE